MLNQENILSSIMKCRRNWCIFFVMEVYLEKTMERLNSGEIKDDLQKHFLYCHHWSDEQWKKSMARGGGNKKRYQYCTDSSGAILYLWALQKAIQDAIPLILLYRTMSLFRTVSSSTFISSDVQPIYIHSIVNSGLIPGGQNLSKRQTVFFTSVDSMNKEHKDPNNIDLESRRLAWYKQKSYIKTQCKGSTSTLLWRKDWSSIRHERTLLSFTKHSQLIVFRKLFGWKLKKSYTRKYMRHLVLLQRFLWNMTGWKNWFSESCWTTRWRSCATI